MPNTRKMGRFREFRKRAALTLEQAAERVGMSSSQLSRVERGVSDFTGQWLRRLATLYQCSVTDLLTDSPAATADVPVTVIVASASSDATEIYDLPPAARYRVTAPTSWASVSGAFAAAVRDNSCDRLFKPGSHVIAVPLDALGRALRQGDKVIVRCYATTRKEGDLMEVLCLVVSQSGTGTITFDAPISVRDKRRHLVLDRTDENAFGLGEGLAAPFQATMPGRAPDIDYRPRDTDPVEIIGVVVAAVAEL